MDPLAKIYTSKHLTGAHSYGTWVVTNYPIRPKNKSGEYMLILIFLFFKLYGSLPLSYHQETCVVATCLIIGYVMTLKMN